MIDRRINALLAGRPNKNRHCDALQVKHDLLIMQRGFLWAPPPPPPYLSSNSSQRQPSTCTPSWWSNLLAILLAIKIDCKFIMTLAILGRLINK